METKDFQVRKKYKTTMGVMKNQPGIPAMAAAQRNGAAPTAGAVTF